MNQRQHFQATVAHEPTGRFLHYAHFTEEARRRFLRRTGQEENTDLEEAYGMLAPVEVSPRKPANWQKPDFSPYFEAVGMPPGSFINDLGVLEIPGSLYHFTRYVSPLRRATTLDELEAFPYPDVSGWHEDHMRAEVEHAHAQGKVTVCHLMHMYEDAWQIRGYEPFLMDMVERPEFCEYILDQVMERNLKKAIAAAKAGVDMIKSGDDVANQRAMMFAPDIWRRLIKSRWAKVYAAARKIKPDIAIWYHSDGDIHAILPELIEIGVTILNPVQPECLDVEKVKREFGDRLVLDGTIGTQTTFPFGTPKEMKALVRQRCDALGQDGGLILSPTHVLEPDVPPENILAFLEACQS